MTNNFRWFVMAGLLAATACGGGSTSDKVEPTKTTTTAATEPSCDAAATNLVTIMAAVWPISEQAFAANRDKIHAAVNKECRSSAWTKEARVCSVAAADSDALDRCGNLLTVEQRESMKTAMKAVLDSASAEAADDEVAPPVG